MSTKIKQRTREKYARFLELGAGSTRRLERVPMDDLGGSAEACFHLMESQGQRAPCREPDLLEQYLTGKEVHGITVNLVAEDFVVSRIITSEEIRRNYPAWVTNEIFQQAKKYALAKLGFVPKFVANERDWSEMSEAETEMEAA